MKVDFQVISKPSVSILRGMCKSKMTKNVVALIFFMKWNESEKNALKMKRNSTFTARSPLSYQKYVYITVNLKNLIIFRRQLGHITNGYSRMLSLRSNFWIFSWILSSYLPTFFEVSIGSSSTKMNLFHTIVPFI